MNYITDNPNASLTDGMHLLVDALKVNGVEAIFGVVGIPVTDLARYAQQAYVVDVVAELLCFSYCLGRLERYDVMAIFARRHVTTWHACRNTFGLASLAQSASSQPYLPPYLLPTLTVQHSLVFRSLLSHLFLTCRRLCDVLNL